MRLAHWIVAVALAAAGCSSSPESRIVDNAADALGGAERIQAVSTLILEGTGENGNLGQNVSPDAPLPIFEVSSYKRILDLDAGRARLEQTRTPTFITANMNPQTQIQAVDGAVGFNVNANGNATRTNELVAKDRRLDIYHHPIAALRAALAEGSEISNARQENGIDVVDVATASGDRFTLHVDADGLPLKVVTMTTNVAPGTVLGDVAVETTFTGYADVDGLQLPARLTTNYDRYTVADIQVSSNTVNGDAGDLAAPQDVVDAAAPALFPEPTVTVEAVSDGVWYLTGQSHHSILVEFADYLALIEAPQNELRTGAVLDAVRELRPEKPLRYVINTHHHFDHSGGIRRVIAEEGVTIITHAANKAFYESLAERPSTLMPDFLSDNPRAATVEGISEKYVLEDAVRTLEIYPVAGNAHADTLLTVYFPAERIIVQADIFTPPGEGQALAASYPFLANFVENVETLGLRPARLMPIHGRIVPYQDLLAANRQ